jgi:hypothetical protein
MSLMARGGARDNAGRPAGQKNKATIVAEIQAAHGIQTAMDSGIMPRDVLLAVMRNQPINGSVPTERQFAAAVAAAPYLHPKLSAAIVKDVSSDSMSVEERRRRVEELMDRHRIGASIDAE